MSKIRILAIPPDTHGVGKYRILNPYTYIQENYPDDFHIDIKYSVPNKDEEFDDYDIVVAHSFIHNTLPYEENVKRIDWLKKKGIIVIIDSDDYWEPDYRHPGYHYIIAEKIPQKKIELFKSATYVTVTTPFYQNTMMKKLGLKNVYSFPNAIDEYEPQFRPNPTKSERIRFGWLGGSSHLHDLKLMESGISMTLSQYKDQVQFVLCGFDLRGKIKEVNKITKEVKERDIRPEETKWYEFESIFTDHYKSVDPEYLEFLKKFERTDYDDLNLSYRRRWTEEINKYAFNYNLFDVSLAPLVDSLFNSNKSQLKIIESGFHKKALIASNVNPYSVDLTSLINFGGGFNDKGNSLLVESSKNHKQWGQHMKRLIENPAMIEDLGNKLYDTVKDKFSLKTVCENRVQFLKSIINH
jgi:glycosyltransferase involved in cell wall biosynthesis